MSTVVLKNLLIINIKNNDVIYYLKPAPTPSSRAKDLQMMKAQNTVHIYLKKICNSANLSEFNVKIGSDNKAKPPY